MSFDAWFVVLGLLLATMALVAPVVRRLPLSASILYLGVGFAIGPAGLRLLDAEPLQYAEVIERVAEVAVLVSLFASGVKTSGALRPERWFLPLRLATLSMVATIGLLALLGVTLLGLPVGAAILLGAILAPTDPVLASDVQVVDASDRDRLRFALTGEAGLNDGTAFPFVLLGLGLLGLHDLGTGGSDWLLRDVLWATAGGLAIGALVGIGLTRILLRLERNPGAAGSPAEHFALGSIALAYGLALAAGTYGFLAVFAAGFAHRHATVAMPAPVRPLHGEAEPEAPPRRLSADVLQFTEQIERIGEVGVVILVGAMLSWVRWEAVWWSVPLLLFGVIRPLAVRLAVPAADEGPDRSRRRLMSWFGIRGIGSIYYLMHSVNHGLPVPLMQALTGITLLVVATSIVLHGVSVTPLMGAYARRVRRAAARGRG
jgi:NhaP-type Na+/H+ or K+/H+ antiporter